MNKNELKDKSENTSGYVFTQLPIIRYKKVRPNECVFTPVKRFEDSDYDLFASQKVTLYRGKATPAFTNIAIELPEGYEAKIESKSGLASQGIFAIGGVIDHGYHGEIVVIMTSNDRVLKDIYVGVKIAQLRIRQCSPHFVFVEQDFQSTSERGDRGFGSTGA